MKRKIFDVIKQKLCRHEFDFVECDGIRRLGVSPSWYFLYRCKKCRKNKIVYIGNIIRDLHDVDPIRSIDYPKETLWLPNTLAYELLAHKWESREAGYLVSKYYNKYGILLTAWGNREFGTK